MRSIRPTAPEPRPRTVVPPARAGRREGFTLVELAIATPLILVAAGMVASTMLANAQRKRTNGENALAATAGQELLERMRNEDFAALFTLYNTDPFDDPLGPGTAPGNRFAVQGLSPPSGVADGTVGEVILPQVNTGGPIDVRLELREDFVAPELGLPRDLNGDLIVDDRDHSGDYRVLPVSVSLRWQGVNGERSFRMHTLLVPWRLAQ